MPTKKRRQAPRTRGGRKPIDEDPVKAAIRAQLKLKEEGGWLEPRGQRYSRYLFVIFLGVSATITMILPVFPSWRVQVSMPIWHAVPKGLTENVLGGLESLANAFGAGFDKSLSGHNTGTTGYVRFGLFVVSFNDGATTSLWRAMAARLSIVADSVALAMQNATEVLTTPLCDANCVNAVQARLRFYGTCASSGTFTALCIWFCSLVYAIMTLVLLFYKEYFAKCGFVLLISSAIALLGEFMWAISTGYALTSVYDTTLYMPADLGRCWIASVMIHVVNIGAALALLVMRNLVKRHQEHLKHQKFKERMMNESRSLS